MKRSSRATAKCPYCGRSVELFSHPDHGIVLMAHRLPGGDESASFKPPWCQGGGLRP